MQYTLIAMTNSSDFTTTKVFGTFTEAKAWLLDFASDWYIGASLQILDKDYNCIWMH